MFLYRGLGLEKSSCNVFSRVKRVEKGATRLEQSQSEVRSMFFLSIVGIPQSMGKLTFRNIT